ncbi:MAG: hypothetical protein ACR2P0_07320 [Acidimicrobiales bacterium]
MLALLISLTTVFTALPAGSTSPHPDPAPATAAFVQIEDLDEPVSETPELGNIVGTPDAGPDPEDAGDRGGWAQLGIALVMFGGIGFIGWRIVRNGHGGRAP